MYRATSRIVARAAIVVLLVAAMTVVGQRSMTADAVTPPRDGYGFSVGAPMTYMSNVDADRELDAVAKTGATWLRVLIDWHLVEPMPGAFNWGYVDHWVDGARQRGLNVLGLIAYTPDWARAPGSYFSAPPVDTSTFAAFAAKVVQRYGDRATNWDHAGGRASARDFTTCSYARGTRDSAPRRAAGRRYAGERGAFA